MLESGNMQQFIDDINSAVDGIVDCENSMLPESTRLVITQNAASIVKDRLELLIRNGWQGLALATLTLLLFFSWRYTFGVALGLPISFVGGLLIMNLFGISINMVSMVALLMASNIAGQKCKFLSHTAPGNRVILIQAHGHGLAVKNIFANIRRDTAVLFLARRQATPAFFPLADHRVNAI
jgi:hypothetical protein